MEVYILHEILEEHGVVFRRQRTKFPEPKSRFRDILMIDGDTLYALSESHEYFRRIHKKISKSIPLEDWEMEMIPSIKMSEIRKVKYRPKFEPSISFGIADGSMYDTDVELFRAVHKDTKVKVALSSLWLVSPKISKVIAPYATATGVMTDFKQVGEYLAIRKINPLRTFQDVLGHVYTSFRWDDKEEKWVFRDES